MSSITVELKTPVEYSFKSEMQKGTFLDISEPTGKVAGLVGNLKAQIGAATKESIKGLENVMSIVDLTDDSDDTPESLGEAGFSMLTMGGADMSVVMESLRDILKETCMVAGEGRFTSPMFDRMSYHDIEKTLKAYIGNFITASI